MAVPTSGKPPLDAAKAAPIFLGPILNSFLNAEAINSERVAPMAAVPGEKCRNTSRQTITAMGTKQSQHSGCRIPESRCVGKFEGDVSPFGVRDIIEHRLVLSSYHLSDRTIPWYLKVLEPYSVHQVYF
jgi:hypothetical protein